MSTFEVTIEDMLASLLGLINPIACSTRVNWVTLHSLGTFHRDSRIRELAHFIPLHNRERHHLRLSFAILTQVHPYPYKEDALIKTPTAFVGMIHCNSDGES
jgi:hypothetical protein